VTKQLPKRTKHIPQRTCIGCRTVLAKKGLIRIVRSPEGVLVDLTGKAPGRGAYIHGVRSCWQSALKGPIANALKTDLSAEDKQRLTEFMQTLPNESESNSTSAGSENGIKP
jgi:predicted RNA-binding protein YlxR (DUF448 family)